MEAEITYLETLKKPPHYSVWHGKELLGYTDKKGFIQYDVTAKKIPEQPIPTISAGYNETPYVPEL